MILGAALTFYHLPTLCYAKWLQSSPTLRLYGTVALPGFSAWIPAPVLEWVAGLPPGDLIPQGSKRCPLHLHWYVGSYH